MPKDGCYPRTLGRIETKEGFCRDSRAAGICKIVVVCLVLLLQKVCVKGFPMSSDPKNTNCSLRENIEQTVKKMSPVSGHDHDHEQNHARGVGIDTVEHLAKHIGEFMTDSSVIIGVGNEMSGDDGAGAMVAKEIEGKVPWKVFNVQSVPESFLMKIVSVKPDTVLIIDALSFDAAAGSVELFSSESIVGQGPSTHGPAPIAFLDVLNMFHPCRRVVLGIQPVRTDFGSEMSDKVTEAVKFVCRAFIKAAENASD